MVKVFTLILGCYEMEIGGEILKTNNPGPLLLGSKVNAADRIC